MNLRTRLHKVENTLNPPPAAPDRNPCAGLAQFMRAALLRWNGADVPLPPAPPVFVQAIQKMRARATRNVR